jgi:hypothetical protein
VAQETDSGKTQFTNAMWHRIAERRCTYRFVFVLSPRFRTASLSLVDQDSSFGESPRDVCDYLSGTPPAS